MLRRIALALIAVSVLLGGLAWVRQRDRGAARDLRAATQLPFFDESAVTAFVLEKASTPWRVVRVPSGWRIASPVDDIADPRAVEALIAAARRSPIAQAIDDPEPPSSYGLAPPVARLTLEGVAAPAIEIGHVAPTGDAVFARVAGRPGVLLLGLPMAGALADADPSALRRRSLVDFAQSEVVGIETAPGGLRLSRGSDGWWIEAPRRLPASSLKVEKLLGAWYGAKVVGWDDTGSPGERRYGLADGSPRITVRSSSSARTMTVGAEAGNGRRFVLCDDRKAILLVDAAVTALALPDIEALRAAALTNVNRYEVKSFVYADGHARFAATRKGEGTWTTDTGAGLPEADVYALLVRLLEAPTAAWSEAPTGKPPRATFEYVTDKGKAGRLAFFDDRASWDALPGVVFRLASPPPPVPNPTFRQ